MDPIFESAERKYAIVFSMIAMWRTKKTTESRSTLAEGAVAVSNGVKDFPVELTTLLRQTVEGRPPWH